MMDLGFNPELDLRLERTVDVPPELVWKAWTEPEHLKPWFAPAPWQTIDCEIDLRPGGIFRTVMRAPDGTEHPSEGCYLEIIPNRRLVWTDTLTAGYRPADKPFFTGIITLEPSGAGTRYTAVARHGLKATRDSHDKMGFHGGWSTCLDQLVAMIKR